MFYIMSLVIFQVVVSSDMLNVTHRSVTIYTKEIDVTNISTRGIQTCFSPVKTLKISFNDF